MMGEGLTKKERLSKSKEFEYVFRYGKSRTGNILKTGSKENTMGFSRIGIIVRRRVAKAVMRNRVRRMTREVFRLNKDRMRSNYDIVVLVNAIPKGVCYGVIEKELITLFSDMGMMK